VSIFLSRSVLFSVLVVRADDLRRSADIYPTFLLFIWQLRLYFACYVIRWANSTDRYVLLGKMRDKEKFTQRVRCAGHNIAPLSRREPRFETRRGNFFFFFFFFLLLLGSVVQYCISKPSFAQAFLTRHCLNSTQVTCFTSTCLCGQLRLMAHYRVPSLYSMCFVANYIWTCRVQHFTSPHLTSLDH
jgi:hypothetical protein